MAKVGSFMDYCYFDAQCHVGRRLCLLKGRECMTMGWGTSLSCCSRLRGAHLCSPVAALAFVFRFVGMSMEWGASLSRCSRLRGAHLCSPVAALAFVFRFVGMSMEWGASLSRCSRLRGAHLCSPVAAFAFVFRFVGRCALLT